MSGNKLLAENTIRRFMKLANVDTMTNNFVTEMYGSKQEDDKDVKTEEVDETNEETVTEEEEADLNEEIDALQEEEELEDEPAAEEEMEMELGAEEPEMGAADMSLTEEEASLLIDLGKRLEEAMGGAMDEPAMDEPAMDEPAMDMDEPAMDEPTEEDEEMMQEELVNEVLKRVTKRIVAAKLQNRK